MWRWFIGKVLSYIDPIRGKTKKNQRETPGPGSDQWSNFWNNQVFRGFTIAFVSLFHWTVSMIRALSEEHKGEAHYHTWIVILVGRGRDRVLLINWSLLCGHCAAFKKDFQTLFFSCPPSSFSYILYNSPPKYLRLTKYLFRAWKTIKNRAFATVKNLCTLIQHYSLKLTVFTAG